MIRTSAFAGGSGVLLLILSLSGFLSPLDAHAQSPLSDLFQQGKAESKLGSYEVSLATFQKLDELSRRPGNEAARVKLEPLIAFYRGVNLAMLGRNEAARKEFETYLASFPTARLDPAMFPRAAIDVFNKTSESARRERAGAGGHPQTGEESPIAADYARFRPDFNRPAAFDQKWAEGAIRFLMTKEENETWKRTQDPESRAEFIAKFWQRRDPSPLTPENELREEIERRIQFADARFAADETRGSETDRGLVFVLLGPPSYIAQRPFRSQDDSIQAARNAPIQELVGYDRQGRKILQSVPRTPLTAETIQGTREIWYYRRDRLPNSIRFPEVDFEFVTGKGIGTAVLQRDPDILVTLDLVAKAILPSQD
jgi:GWxTD domain-containing protein